MIAIVTKVLVSELSAQCTEYCLTGVEIDLHVIRVAGVENLEMLAPYDPARMHMAALAAVECCVQKTGGYLVIGAA
jgi:hypothetical protein